MNYAAIEEWIKNEHPIVKDPANGYAMPLDQYAAEVYVAKCQDIHGRKLKVDQFKGAEVIIVSVGHDEYLHLVVELTDLYSTEVDNPILGYMAPSCRVLLRVSVEADVVDPHLVIVGSQVVAG